MKTLASLGVLAALVLSATAGDRDKQKTEDLLDRTLVPQLEFRNAQLDDVLEFLVASVRARHAEDFNVVNLAGAPAARNPKPVAAAPEQIFFGNGDDFFRPAPQPAAKAQEVPRITINVRNMSLRDALDFITEMAGLEYHIKKNVVVITRKGHIRNPETRIYRVNDPRALQEQLQQLRQRQQPRDPFAAPDNPFR